jgi:serine/threonine protein kinase
MEMNLYEAIENRKKYLPEKKAKYWIYQTLKALEYMHKNGIFHRDIKPENILLLKNRVKLADLGSCKGMYSKPPFTEYISTRWYRSPECLLTDGYYNYKMDIWGLGCVFYEILTLEPLFPGDDEIDQVNKINYILGSPPNDLFEKFVKNSAHRNEFNFEYQKGVGINKYLSHVSANVVDLIGKMLIYDPDLRPTARDCLNHECFKEFVEQDLKNKLNQNNFYQDSSFMKSFNDSLSIKNDESIQIVNLNNLNNNNINNNYNNSKTLKTKKEASNSNLNNINTKYNYNNILLPVLKLNNINEDSKGEDSFNNSSIIKKNIDPYLKLPKIAEKNNNIFDAVNFMNSNEFKRLKHNISNHSIDKVMSSAFTIYEKKQKVNIKKRINEVKKNYISPYSKKIIENNLII